MHRRLTATSFHYTSKPTLGEGGGDLIEGQNFHSQNTESFFTQKIDIMIHQMINPSFCCMSAPKHVQQVHISNISRCAHIGTMLHCQVLGSFYTEIFAKLCLVQ